MLCETLFTTKVQNYAVTAPVTAQLSANIWMPDATVLRVWTYVHVVQNFTIA
jgi:hypothetical protein